jgi:hypothetical protein
MRFIYVNIKNIFCVLAMVLCLAVTSYSYADSAAVRVINTSGSGQVNLTVKNRSDNEPTPGELITWSDVSVGSTGWKVADQYIEISYSDDPPLPQFWGMQIYTDNESDTADPQYTGTRDPAGLVKTDNTIFSLPIAWRITDVLISNPDNPVQRPDGSGFEDYMWHFLKDKNTPDEGDIIGTGATITGIRSIGADLQITIRNVNRALNYNIYKRENLMSGEWQLIEANYPAESGDSTSWTDTDSGNMSFYKFEVSKATSFVDGDDYITLWNQSGIAWNEGGRSGNPKKAYIYLAANFTMSSTGATYRTSVLTIEAYKGVSPFPIYLYKDAPLTEYPDEPGATLENHFSPSGWMNAHGQYSIDSKSQDVTPYSGTHCFKIYWNGTRTWGGIMWLEPENVWSYGAGHPTHNGYDLRGADELSFWARTSAANSGMQLEIGFGNNWDSDKTPSIWRTPLLNTTWQRYSIPLYGLDLSNISGGLSVVFNASKTPNYSSGAVIYLDDIKFDEYE